ncbi:MAG: hypothetical protein C0582_02860 [Alphaproteobacteria bacterium]|nr:MAG: hypothetical protein C0582_02860 [Alphaproteobacteria bacterium]
MNKKILLTLFAMGCLNLAQAMKFPLESQEDRTSFKTNLDALKTFASSKSGFEGVPTAAGAITKKLENIFGAEDVNAKYAEVAGDIDWSNGLLGNLEKIQAAASKPDWIAEEKRLHFNSQEDAYKDGQLGAVFAALAKPYSLASVVDGWVEGLKAHCKILDLSNVVDEKNHSLETLTKALDEEKAAKAALAEANTAAEEAKKAAVEAALAEDNTAAEEAKKAAVEGVIAKANKLHRADLQKLQDELATARKELEEAKKASKKPEPASAADEPSRRAQDDTMVFHCG